MGKSVIHDPERAPLVRRAFEDYATGRFTKQQVLEQARAWGLTNAGTVRSRRTRSGLLSNQPYAGIVDVPEYLRGNGEATSTEPLARKKVFTKRFRTSRSGFRCAVRRAQMSLRKRDS